MRKKNYKGRCEKLSVSKSKDVCRMYSELQKKYLYKLQDNEHIREIRCNVLMEGFACFSISLKYRINPSLDTPISSRLKPVFLKASNTSCAVPPFLIISSKYFFELESLVRKFVIPFKSISLWDLPTF